MKRYIKSNSEFGKFEDGYDKAMKLSTRNGFYDGTYSYDSTKRIFELAAKDPDYENSTHDYKRGFAAAVYDLFRV